MKSIFPYPILIFVGTLLTFGGCSTSLRVYSEEQLGVNLAQYYSYDWLDHQEVPTGTQVPYPLSYRAGDQIRSATDAQMQRYGYQCCDVAPDLHLHYHVIVENRVYFQQEWSCNTPEDMRLGKCQRVQPMYFQEGTIIIDFMDAKTGQQVWRGVAVGAIENYTPAQWDAEVGEAIGRIFKKFPIRPLPQRPAGALANARGTDFK